MKYTAILFCLAATAVAAMAASVSGQASIDRNAVAVLGKLVFPRIPGFNAPLSSLFPSRQTTSTTTSTTTSRTTSGSNDSTTTSRTTNGSNDSTTTNGSNDSTTTSGSNDSTTTSGSNDSTTTSSSNDSTTTSGSNDSTTSGSNDSTTTNGPNDSTTTNGSNDSTTSSSNDGSLLNKFANLFDIPDPATLIPNLLSPGNSSSVEVPEIPSLPDLSQLPRIPGLSNAIQEARNHVQVALQLGNDITGGIQQAIQEAFDSNDPTSAIRTIARTIIDAYLTVAANCPVMIVGNRVIQEGIRLAIEVAKSATNVVFGTSTASP